MTHRRHFARNDNQASSEWHVQHHQSQNQQQKFNQQVEPKPTQGCDIQEYIAARLADIIMNTSTDRTSEFLSVVQQKALKLKQNPNHSQHLLRHAQGGSDSRSQPGGGVATIRQRQEFNQHAKQIGQNLARTFEKLEKLTMLCKKRTLFDDRPVEIQELTHIIKQDIDGLKKGLVALEGSAKTIPTRGRKDVANQTRAQIKELTSRIGTASKSFINVMELRRDNIKIQNSRREQFTGSSSPATDGVRNRRQQQTNQAFAMFEEEHRNSILSQDQVRATQDSVDQKTLWNAQQQDMQLMQQEDNYARERETNMESIEAAITEIGSVMRQLGTMVAEQQETVLRIDSNVESAEMSIENAHGEILKYFQSVTNNRWLMVKVFGTLVTFFIIFIVFFA